MGCVWHPWGGGAAAALAAAVCLGCAGLGAGGLLGPDRGRRTGSGVEDYHAPCPAVIDPYLPEPSPFGWPLAPGDWGFERPDCWKKHHLICGGRRQSPLDIDLTLDPSVCPVTVGGGDGALAAVSHYYDVGQRLVRVSKYMDTAMVYGSFGHLNVKEDGNRDVRYNAVQVHVTTPSLHRVNGTLYDAEMFVVHKPEGDPDMLRAAVIVSVLFQHGDGYSKVFEGLGFPRTGDDLALRVAESSWMSQTEINLPADLAEALRGPSYLYNGSVPVPPCSETVKWIILPTPRPISRTQTSALRQILIHHAGGVSKRPVKPRNDFEGECRHIAVNSVHIGGHHDHHTCETVTGEGNAFLSSRCWDTVDRCWSKCYSAVDIRTMEAVVANPFEPINVHTKDEIWHYKERVNNVRVLPSMYSLDASVDGGHGNFGHLLLNGHIYFAMNISIKAISQHTIDSVRHEGELMIEHVMFGDTFGERLPGEDDLHKVMVSVPLKVGKESSLLRNITLEGTTQKAISDSVPYYTGSKVINLMEGLRAVIDGDWFWYSSNSTHPGCGTSVRWMVFKTPIEVSLDQLNVLHLRVSGVDSSQLAKPMPPHSVWKKHLPASAVEANETDCETLVPSNWSYGDAHAPWDYGNERCWGTLDEYRLCGSGRGQSPIDIPAGSATPEGSDNFLHRCSWKPVADLRVANTGHNLQVTDHHLGYFTWVGKDGFPQYYEVAQFHVHMPSEHMIGGRQYAAELHIVHKRQRAVNDLDSNDLLVVGIMFDLGENESPLLKQMFLPDVGAELDSEGSYEVVRRPLDLMRAFGTALDGRFHRYDGSLTTPPCSEVVKWFVFEEALDMSMEQWLAFKKLYPNPNNNRPIQPLNGRKVAVNSFEEGTPLDYRFYLNRAVGRDRREPSTGAIAVPVIGTILLGVTVMVATFVREDARRKRTSAGGLAEQIGSPLYDHGGAGASPETIGSPAQRRV